MKRRIFLTLFLGLFGMALMGFAQHTETYSLATDFGSSFNASNFETEVSGSIITRNLRAIQTAGDVISVIFEGGSSLPSADLDLLQGASYPSPIGGLIAAHDTTPKAPVSTIKQIFSTGDHRATIDGHQMSIGIDSWGRMDYPLIEVSHLQGIQIAAEASEAGDYANLSILHPSSETSVSTTETAATTEVDVGAASAYYDPALGAEYLEVWDSANTTPQEIHAIDHLAGNVVHLKTALVDDLDVDEKVWASFGAFSPVRGADGLSGGYHLKPNPVPFRMFNEKSMTPMLAAGLIFSARVKTANSGGTRTFVCNYILRRHLPGDVDE